uniref:Uncharacterized protein n=1 Tax=viral metagenome TaxID=1070528 RepID=A0A6C0KQ07_9ZZZZ
MRTTGNRAVTVCRESTNRFDRYFIIYLFKNGCTRSTLSVKLSNRMDELLFLFQQRMFVMDIFDRQSRCAHLFCTIPITDESCIFCQIRDRGSNGNGMNGFILHNSGMKISFDSKFVEQHGDIGHIRIMSL